RMRIGGSGPSDEPEPWRSPWAADDGFALAPLRSLAIDIVVDGVERQALGTWGARGREVSVDGIAAQRAGRIIALSDGVAVAGRRTHHVAFKRHDMSGAAPTGEDAVRAPMNGKIIAVLVEPGQQVKLGARVAVMEAMKMEHSLTAPRDGTVAAVAAAGTQVVEGAPVVQLEPGGEA